MDPARAPTSTRADHPTASGHDLMAAVQATRRSRTRTRSLRRTPVPSRRHDRCSCRADSSDARRAVADAGKRPGTRARLRSLGTPPDAPVARPVVRLPHSNGPLTSRPREAVPPTAATVGGSDGSSLAGRDGCGAVAPKPSSERRASRRHLPICRADRRSRCRTEVPLGAGDVLCSLTTLASGVHIRAICAGGTTAWMGRHRCCRCAGRGLGGCLRSLTQ